jgi:hypothetical protein
MTPSPLTIALEILNNGPYEPSRRWRITDAVGGLICRIWLLPGDIYEWDNGEQSNIEETLADAIHSVLWLRDSDTPAAHVIALLRQERQQLLSN